MGAMTLLSAVRDACDHVQSKPRSVSTRRRSSLKAGIVVVAGARHIDRHVADDPARPGAEHQHAVRKVECLVHVVGDQQGGEAAGLPEPQQLSLQGDTGQRVELAQRLVQQQQRRLVHQRTGQRRPLGHAAGELVGMRPAQRRSGQPVRAQSSTRGSSLRKMPRASRPSATFRQTVRQGNSVGSWKTSARSGSGAVTCRPPDPDRTRGGLLQPGDDPQQGRLAAAARSQQGDERPRRDGEADLLQHRERGALDRKPVG